MSIPPILATIPFILAFLSSSTQTCLAADPEIKPHLMVVDPSWPASQVNGRDIEIHSADERPDSIGPKERDSMLLEAGVSQETTRWSQLDKNLLFLRATYLSTQEMKERYPHFTESQLDAVIGTAKKHEAGSRL